MRGNYKIGSEKSFGRVLHFQKYPWKAFLSFTIFGLGVPHFDDENKSRIAAARPMEFLPNDSERGRMTKKNLIIKAYGS